MGRRSGAGQDWVPKEQFANETSVPRILQRIVDTTLERPPEAQASEILCNPNAGTKSPVDERFIRGTRGALCSGLLTRGPSPFFVFVNPFHARHVREPTMARAASRWSHLAQKHFPCIPRKEIGLGLATNQRSKCLPSTNSILFWATGRSYGRCVGSR